MTKEDKFIFSCLTGVDLDLINQIPTDNLDWEYILGKAMAEGIAPLLYYNLCKAALKTQKQAFALHNLGGSFAQGTLPLQIPQDKMLKLKEVYIRNLGRNIMVYKELGRVLRAFDEENIKPIVLKGALLAVTVYDNIGLRAFSDIDLLVRKQNLALASEKLAVLGYSECDKDWDESEGSHLPGGDERYRWLFAFHLPGYELQMGSQLEVAPTTNHLPSPDYIGISKQENPKISIELHWDVHPLICKYRYSLAELWKTAEQVEIAGVSTLSLSSENTILYLLLHIAMHSPRLIWCVDIVKLIEKRTIDWKEFQRKAEKNRIPVYQTLSFIERNFNIPLPENIQSKIKDYRSGDWERKKFKDLQLQYISGIRGINGFWNKIRLVLMELFPDKKFMMQRYRLKSPKFILLSYIFRLARALVKGLILPFTAVVRGKGLVKSDR